MNGKREYGDYQTPFDFAERICNYLKFYRHLEPTAVIEPTCGQGNFLRSSLLFDAEEYYGIEINPDYCKICKNVILDNRVQVIHGDFFTSSTRALVRNPRQILVIGNPPWATNSMLSTLGSDNMPVKANIKGVRGIEAMTGMGNFDICESMLLKLTEEYKSTNTVIAMLCKTSVARNVFLEMKRNGSTFISCDLLEFDAGKIFHINASACLMVIQMSEKAVSPEMCDIYDFDSPDFAKAQLWYENGQLFSKTGEPTEDFDGCCCFEWRQGVKHDCADVMELELNDGVLKNRQKEPVNIETDIVYPLVKSSMFKSPVIHNFSRYVIVTQRKPREQTSYLAEMVPRTWEYLSENAEAFQNRKSSIYRNAPPFSMFGVGDYSYSRYKVGVSGFYKRPLFSVLYSDNAKPVMTDDTSYFICFKNFNMAYVAMLLLNSKQVQQFLSTIAFADAKRPYTKKVLERIDFEKIAGCLSIENLKTTEQHLKLNAYVTDSMYSAFKAYIAVGQMRLA